MSIYSIVLSNSTIYDDDINTIASWTVRGETIPISGQIELVESISVHLSPTYSGAQPHSKAIVVDIPWLNSASHSCGNGYNVHPVLADGTGADQPTLDADIGRTPNNVGIILQTPVNTNCVCHTGEVYECGHTQIPSTYTVSVRTLGDNLPYYNIDHLVLKFRIHRSGNF